MSVGLFDDLGDKLKKKRQELQSRAAKKAAKMALEGAKRAVDSAGKAIEKAVFGEAAGGDESKTPEPPDPFAHLKARERERKERGET